MPIRSRLLASIVLAGGVSLGGCETIGLYPEPMIEPTEWGNITVWHYPPGYNNSAYGYREMWATNTTSVPYCVIVTGSGYERRVTAPANAETRLLERGRVPETGAVDWTPGAC